MKNCSADFVAVPISNNELGRVRAEGKSVGLPRALFDIQDRAWLSYIKTYLQYLMEHMDSVAFELSIDPEGGRRKLDYLLRLKTRGDVYKACNFDSIVTDVTDKPFLSERSLDFVVSNCVLSHIPPSELSRMGG